MDTDLHLTKVAQENELTNNTSLGVDKEPKFVLLAHFMPKLSTNLLAHAVLDVAFHFTGLRFWVNREEMAERHCLCAAFGQPWWYGSVTA